MSRRNHGGREVAFGTVRTWVDPLHPVWEQDLVVREADSETLGVFYGTISGQVISSRPGVGYHYMTARGEG